ncbi:MAG: MFS transporter [Chloroflexi bacterium]|nr:MFS transporter [Chloroflexota bacterium]
MSTTQQQPSRRLVSALFFLGFILMGASITLIGATILQLTERFAVPLANGGIFSTAHSIGVVIGLFFGGSLYDRLPARLPLMAGLAATGIGLIGLTVAPSLWVALLSLGMWGLGFGTFLLGPNVIIARISPNPSSAVNALNVGFGVGAIAGPQVVSLMLSLGNERIAYVVFAVIALALTVPIILTNIPNGRDETSDDSGPLNWRVLAPLCLLIFFGLGVEVGMNLWIVPQLELVAGAPSAVSILGVSIFWVGMTTSRGLAGVVTARPLSDENMMLIYIGAIALGISIVLSFSTSALITLVGAFVFGLGAGPVYPTAAVLLLKLHPQAFGTASGVMGSLGNVGAIILPWLQGQVGGGTSGGMIQILALSAVMLGAALIIRRLEAPPAATGMSPAR